VQTGFCGQCLLRKARCLSPSSQDNPESALKWMHG
jgi:hypothetical protein